MGKDIIYREDAIEALKGRENILHDAYTAVAIIRSIPSADRPQGEVDAVEIYERAEHNLEQGYITIGEFDERIEPLRHLCYGRPQGEWKGYEIPSECSVCGHHWDEYVFGQEIWHDGSVPNYCPHCGAKMKGTDDE